MSWLAVAIATIVFYSLFDLFLKLSSDKLNVAFNAFLINIVAAAVLFIFMMYSKFQGEKILEFKPNGILFSVLAGIAVGMASIFFTKLFAIGTNLSIGVPLVRIGMVVLASILGILLLKEGINLKYILGILLSLAGLFLVITK